MKKKDKPPPCIGCNDKILKQLSQITHVVYLTQEEYDALETKDPTTLYSIKDK